MGHNSVFVNKVVCAFHFSKASVGENRKNPRKKESELRDAALRNDWALKISGTGCLVGQLVSWDMVSQITIGFLNVLHHAYVSQSPKRCRESFLLLSLFSCRVLVFSEHTLQLNEY